MKNEGWIFFYKFSFSPSRGKKKKKKKTRTHDAAPAHFEGRGVALAAVQRSQHLVAGAELLDSRNGDGGLPRRAEGGVERL